MRTFHKKGEEWYFGDFKIELELTSFYDLDEQCRLKANFETPYERVEWKIIDVITHHRLYKEVWNSELTNSIEPILVIQTETGSIWFSWIHIIWDVDKEKILSCYDINTIVPTFSFQYLNSFASVRERGVLRSDGSAFVNLLLRGKKRTLEFPYRWWSPCVSDNKTVKWLIAI